jgi:hypothetical protein
MRYRVAVRLAATLLVVSFVPAVRANHTIFDYAVDRVEFDGNLHGPADGTPDVVEEFDDGVLGPVFQRLFGTVTEAGGYMILKNPGTHFAISGLLVLDDDGAVVDANMPAGPGCGPLDGWALVGSTYRYRNVSGGLPPTCSVGSGHKMTAKLRFEGLNTARFKAKVTRTTIGVVSGPLDLDLIRNVTVDPPDCQHYAHTGYECQVGASKVKCH